MLVGSPGLDTGVAVGGTEVSVLPSGCVPSVLDDAIVLVGVEILVLGDEPCASEVGDSMGVVVGENGEFVAPDNAGVLVAVWGKGECVAVAVGDALNAIRRGVGVGESFLVTVMGKRAS